MRIKFIKEIAEIKNKFVLFIIIFIFAFPTGFRFIHFILFQIIVVSEIVRSSGYVNNICLSSV